MGNVEGSHIQPYCPLLCIFFHLRWQGSLPVASSFWYPTAYKHNSSIHYRVHRSGWRVYPYSRSPPSSRTSGFPPPSLASPTNCIFSGWNPNIKVNLLISAQRTLKSHSRRFGTGGPPSWVICCGAPSCVCWRLGLCGECCIAYMIFRGISREGSVFTYRIGLGP